MFGKFSEFSLGSFVLANFSLNLPQRHKAGGTLVAILSRHRKTRTQNKIWTQENEQLTTFLTETEF